MSALATSPDIDQYRPMTQMTPVLVRMSAELIAQIDAARGDVPRAVFIRRCCEGVVTPKQAHTQFMGMNVEVDSHLSPNTIVIRPPAPLGPERPRPGDLLKKPRKA